MSVILFIAGIFALDLHGPSVRISADQNQQQQQYEYTSDSQPNSEPAAESSDERLAEYTKWLAILTGVLSACSLAGIVISYFQWNALKAQDVRLKESIDKAEAASAKQFEIADRNARAAERAADATLAALDRPWLFIDPPQQNRPRWLRGEGPLEAMLTIGNYGSAPAVVHAIYGRLFIAPRRGIEISQVPFDVKSIGAMQFPKPSELERFRLANRRTPFRWPSEFFVDSLGTPPTALGQHTARYSVPFVIPIGADSDGYKIVGMPKIISIPKDAMPLQGAMHVYLIGTIAYSGPDEELQHLDFCFEQGLAFGMLFCGGRPYNWRHKAEPMRVG
jgi:hypothetical protein